MAKRFPEEADYRRFVLKPLRWSGITIPITIVSRIPEGPRPIRIYFASGKAILGLLPLIYLGSLIFKEPLLSLRRMTGISLHSFEAKLSRHGELYQDILRA
jgi:hypothetical protein